MALWRTLPLRGAARAGSARTTSRVGRVQRGAGRRSYASGPGEAAKKVGSDMPWLAGSVVAAIVPTVLILRGGDLHNPFSYPKPGSNYHGEEHGEEHEEEEDGEGEQEENSEEGDEEKSEDKSEEKSDEKSEDKEDKDGDDSDSDSSSSSGSKSDWQEVDKDGETGSRKLKKEDAKGGVKRRIESGNAIKQGSGENEDDNVNKKTPVAGSVSKAQAGISNTDTKHSINLMDSQHSKKPEGAPDTAKLTGTVDPHRGKPKE